MRRQSKLTVGSKVKQTLVTLKSAKSTLRMYSLQTQNKKAKEVYKEALKATEDIVSNLEGRVKFIEYEEPQYKGN